MDRRAPLTSRQHHCSLFVKARIKTGRRQSSNQRFLNAPGAPRMATVPSLQTICHGSSLEPDPGNMSDTLAEASTAQHSTGMARMEYQVLDTVRRVDHASHGFMQLQSHGLSRWKDDETRYIITNSFLVCLGCRLRHVLNGKQSAVSDAGSNDAVNPCLERR